MDLATPEGVDQLWQRIEDLARPVDSIALNAGVGVNGPFIDSDLDAHMRLIGLNISGVVRLSHYVLRDMVSRGEGRVLYTASIAADMPGAYSATYNASKAFDLMFAEALREELKDTGVTITAFQPGPRTPGSSSARVPPSRTPRSPRARGTTRRTWRGTGSRR